MGSSKVGSEIISIDWSNSSLGPLEEWPGTLRTTLNLVLNSGFSSFVGWGPELLCFYNDAYAPIVEGKPDTLGRPLRDVFPESREAVQPLFDKALRGESTYIEKLEVPIMRGGDIQQTWWTASYSPIFDEAGNICGVYVPVHEITDQLAAEAELRQSEETLAVVGDLVPSLLWRVTPQEERIWVNRRMREYLEDGAVVEAVHPNDRASLRREWTRAQNDEDAFHHYHRLRSPTGEYRWHVADAVPRFTASSTINEWCGVATDVHELHLTADALSQSSALFSSFANHSADVLWIADIETGIVEYMSPAFETIWGASSPGTTITWDNWLDTVHPDDRQQQKLSFDRLLSGEVLNEQYRILRPDGSVRWIRDTMFPILAADGTISKIGGIAHDMTRQTSQIVHLIDGGPERRAAMAERLHAKGYQVRPWGSVDPFLRVCRALLPGCVVLLDEHDGTEAERLAAALKGHLQALPLVLICDLTDASTAIRLMKQGVSDIVLPQDPPERVEQAVASALVAMETPFSEESAVQQAKERMQALTDRERDVLEGLSSGATSKMLARDLGISPRTIETYRARILERLDVATLPEAIRIAAIASL